jgi:DNA-binding transcriptional ArsR family regulator
LVKYSIDELAYAVSSAPRRRLLERVAEGPVSMSALAEHLDLSLPAVDKHLKVLGSAGLVTKTKSGRVTQITLDPRGLEAMATWVERTRAHWAGAMQRYTDHLEDR